ncbi:hypothetical protein EVAR_13436_1 [Eumeta japonica]|uniref:Uncharacterized protein n=1 Tax=Eumeta variegata TaxID=151549 RepID=A0A4C1V7J5_EUMVA|nr:hypothetical protein EVAR_13436_1 [Eumeta japonica]
MTLLNSRLSNIASIHSSLSLVNKSAMSELREIRAGSVHIGGTRSNIREKRTNNRYCSSVRGPVRASHEIFATVNNSNIKKRVRVRGNPRVLTLRCRDDGSPNMSAFVNGP